MNWQELIFDPRRPPVCSQRVYTTSHFLSTMQSAFLYNLTADKTAQIRLLTMKGQVIAATATNGVLASQNKAGIVRSFRFDTIAPLKAKYSLYIADGIL